MECKLKLRAPEPADVEFIVELENDESSLEYSDRVAPLSRNSVKSYIMACDPDPFVTGQLRLIAETDDGEKIGLLDYYDISQRHSHAMIGIIIAAGKRGCGLGLRILEMGRAFAARRMHIDQLGAIVCIENKASVKIFQKAGYREVGTLKEWWRKSTGGCDCLLMQKDTRTAAGRQ